MKKRMYGRLVVGLMVIALVAVVMGNLTWASETEEPMDPYGTEEPEEPVSNDPMDPVSSPTCYTQNIPGTFKIKSVEVGITGIPLTIKATHMLPCRGMDCSAEFVTMSFSLDSPAEPNQLIGGSNDGNTEMAMIKIDPVFPSFANLLIAAQQSNSPVKMKKSSCTNAITSIQLGQ